MKKIVLSIVMTLMAPFSSLAQTQQWHVMNDAFAISAEISLVDGFPSVWYRFTVTADNAVLTLPDGQALVQKVGAVSFVLYSFDCSEKGKIRMVQTGNVDMRKYSQWRISQNAVDAAVWTSICNPKIQRPRL